MQKGELERRSFHQKVVSLTATECRSEAGPNPGQVLLGAKRQAYIDACKADANSRPMK